MEALLQGDVAVLLLGLALSVVSQSITQQADASAKTWKGVMDLFNLNQTENKYHCSTESL